MITNKIFLISLLLICLALPMMSATDFQTQPQNKPFELTVQSNNATACNLTYIQYPNGITQLISPNLPLTKSGNTFNRTINASNFGSLGDICMGGLCTDGFNNEPFSICRNITPSGFKNIGTFFFIFIIIIVLVFLAGFKLENKWIMTFASILVLIFGFFIIKFGVDIIKDTQTTWAIGIIVWGLGIYFMYLSLEEQLKEWG